jgi:hypothetical protein
MKESLQAAILYILDQENDHNRVEEIEALKEYAEQNGVTDNEFTYIFGKLILDDLSIERSN